MILSLPGRLSLRALLSLLVFMGGNTNHHSGVLFFFPPLGPGLEWLVDGATSWIPQEISSMNVSDFFLGLLVPVVDGVMSAKAM